MFFCYISDIESVEKVSEFLRLREVQNLKLEKITEKADEIKQLRNKRDFLVKELNQLGFEVENPKKRKEPSVETSKDKKRR